MCCFNFVNYKCVSDYIIYMNVFTCTIKKMGELMAILFHESDNSCRPLSMIGLQSLDKMEH